MACYFPTSWDPDDRVEELYGLIAILLLHPREPNSFFFIGGDFNANFGALQPNQSCSVAPAPSGLPEDVAHLPANIRSPLEELHLFVQVKGSGNVGGSRRPRQHRESRPM